jgi:hypothetical protein
MTFRLFTKPRREFNRAFFIAVLQSLIVLGVGCHSDDGISQRTEPKPPKNEPKSEPNPAEAPYRLLGAVVPSEGAENKWFFLLMGPTDWVAPNEIAFRDFLKTVEFTNNEAEPIRYTAAPDWRKGKINELRYAAFIMGEKDNEVLLTIAQAKGDLADNLKRYRSLYLGLNDFKANDVPKYTREMEIGGRKAVWIDMSGPGGPGLAKREVK